MKNRAFISVALAAVGLGLAVWWTLGGDEFGQAADRPERTKGTVEKLRNGVSDRAVDGSAKMEKWRSQRMRIEDHLGKGGRVVPPSGTEKNWVAEFGGGKTTITAARLTAGEDSLIFGGPLTIARENGVVTSSEESTAEVRVNEKGARFSTSAGRWITTQRPK